MFKQLQRENRKLKAKQRQSELDAKNWIRDLHGSLSELSGESSLDVMKEKVRSVKMDVEMEMGRFMLGLGHKMGHD